MTDLVSMTPVYIALIAVAQLVLLASVQGWISSRKERRDAALQEAKEARDYARQDLVADRVALAAKEVATVAREAAASAALLVKAQAETIARTDEVARLAAAADERIAAQLTALDEQGKKIHILVNSDMTAARTNERDQTRLTLLALKRVQGMSVKLGINSTIDEENAIAAAEKRILELDQILADRHAAQLVVDDEARRHADEEVAKGHAPVDPGVK
jgi:hypothetical protein